MHACVYKVHDAHVVFSWGELLLVLLMYRKEMHVLWIGRVLFIRLSYLHGTYRSPENGEVSRVPPEALMHLHDAELGEGSCRGG